MEKQIKNQVASLQKDIEACKKAVFALQESYAETNVKIDSSSSSAVPNGKSDLPKSVVIKTGSASQIYQPKSNNCCNSNQSSLPCCNKHHKASTKMYESTQVPERLKPSSKKIIKPSGKTKFQKKETWAKIFEDQSKKRAMSSSNDFFKSTYESKYKPCCDTEFCKVTNDNNLQDLLEHFRSRLLEQNQMQVTNIVKEVETAISKILMNELEHRNHTTDYSKNTLEAPRFNGHNCFTNQQFSRKNDHELLNMKLAEGYRKMELTCQNLETVLKKSKQEKYYLQRDVNDLKKELEEMQRKELLYKEEIRTFKSQAAAVEKIGTQNSESVQELGTQLRKAQDEITALTYFKDMYFKSKTEADTIRKENFDLQNEIHILRLDNEKNVALIKVKNERVDKLKQELRRLKGVIKDELSRISPGREERLENDERDLVSSSPNSSCGSVSPSASSSWRRLSKVPKAPLAAELRAGLKQIIAETRQQTEEWNVLPDSSISSNL